MFRRDSLENDSPPRGALGGRKRAAFRTIAKTDNVLAAALYIANKIGGCFDSISQGSIVDTTIGLQGCLFFDVS